MPTATRPPADAVPPRATVVLPRFEYNLLRILRFLLGDVPAAQVRDILDERRPAPPCLSRSCVRLVQDTLAKGCVLHLVKAGGWRNDRTVGGGEPRTGRVWERVPLAERKLSFGPHVVSFLMWLTAERVTDTKEKWDPADDTLTAADELFFYRAFTALHEFPHYLEVMAGRRAFRGNGLCRLAAPASFADALPDFEPWTTGLRSVLLECLQPALAERWIRSERAKGQLADWGQLRRTGEAEGRLLTAYLKACSEANRPDLARFVLKTLQVILAPNDLTAGFWTGGLQGPAPGRIADRIDTQRAALAVLRTADVLDTWERQARSVGYFDDGYAVSQVWKADWEAAGGEALAAKARSLLEQVEPLRMG